MKEDLNYWILKVIHDSDWKENAEYLKIPSTISYSQIVKICAYVCKVYNSKKRNEIFHFISCMEMALTLSTLCGFKRLSENMYKDETTQENNRMKSLYLYMLDESLEFSETVYYEKIISKKVIFNRKANSLKITNEEENFLEPFSSKEIEKAFDLTFAEYPTGYFEKDKMKNYSLPHKMGLFVYLNADFSPYSSMNDKIVFLPYDKIISSFEDLKLKIFYLNAKHEEMKSKDWKYSEKFRHELSKKSIVELLNRIYDIKSFPEKDVSLNCISLNLFDIQIDPHKYYFETDYSNIIATNVSQELLYLAIDEVEVEDEDLRYYFTEKIEKHPNTDAPEGLDLQFIKDYYKNNLYK